MSPASCGLKELSKQVDLKQNSSACHISIFHWIRSTRTCIVIAPFPSSFWRHRESRIHWCGDPGAGTTLGFPRLLPLSPPLWWISGSHALCQACRSWSGWPKTEHRQLLKSNKEPSLRMDLFFPPVGFQQVAMFSTAGNGLYRRERAHVLYAAKL